MKRKTRYLLRLFTSKRKESKWVIFILFLISPILFIAYLIKRLKRNKIFNEGYELAIKDLSPYEFEYYIASIFIKLGFKVKVTSASNDFGVDIIARNKNEVVAIQVKKYINHPVGNRDVQMLLGAMQQKKIKANRSILITTSYFTKSARIQSEGCPIELWDENRLKEIISNLPKD